MALAAVLVGAPSAMRAETLDRVVASVGDVAITQSDVDAEYRVEFFLQYGRVPPSAPDASSFNQVRDHLVSGEVLAQEADTEQTSVDVSGRVAQRLDALRKKFPTEAAFERAFRTLGLTDKQLVDALTAQEHTLALIDRQLRPQASVDQAEIEDYYRNTFLPDFAREQKGDPPSLASVGSRIREILIQKKINQLLPGWIEGLKSNHRVRILNGHDA